MVATARFLQHQARRYINTQTAKLPVATIPKLGRQVTRLGFGAYRVSRGTSKHELALRQALGAGINIIDTASNFQNGIFSFLVF